MVDCAIELFGVEWIGDEEPVLFQLAPLFGSLFVALAAAYAARLAAITANERHREQLEHDTQRQREELAHDRNMRKLEHARDAVDKAMELADQVHTKVEEVRVSAMPLEVLRAEHEAVDSEQVSDSDRRAATASALRELEKQFFEEVIEARRGLIAMHSAGFSLSLTLGAAHPVRDKYRGALTARSELLDMLAVSGDRQRDADEKATADDVYHRAKLRYAELLAASEAWLQSQEATQT